MLILVLGVLGCSSPEPRSPRLTARQASDLALRLANHKTQERYQFAPFRYGPPARLVDGYWVWHTWRDYGFGDRIEARVKFALDGSNPKADVYFVARLPQPLHLP